MVVGLKPATCTCTYSAFESRTKKTRWKVHCFTVLVDRINACMRHVNKQSRVEHKCQFISVQPLELHDSREGMYQRIGMARKRHNQRLCSSWHQTRIEHHAMKQWATPGSHSKVSSHSPIRLFWFFVLVDLLAMIQACIALQVHLFLSKVFLKGFAQDTMGSDGLQRHTKHQHQTGKV